MGYSEKQILDYIKEANNLLPKSYSPYSKFQVAAILIDEEGKIHKGVNVENASFGLSICAERNVISSAITEGMKKIRLIVITANTEEPVSPCGMCRQYIREFSDEKTLIILGNSKNDKYIKWTVEEMIPYSFGPEHL